MAWPVPKLASLPPFVRGFRAQWLASARGDNFPVILACVGHSASWLATLARARAVACGSADAELLVSTLEAELATVTSLAAPHWPMSFCAPCAVPDSEFGKIDPGASLILDPGPASDERVRSVLSILSVQAFGNRGACGGVDRLTRIRSAARVLPAGLRDRWAGETTLDPPSETLLLARQRAMSLVSTALPENACRPLRWADVRPLSEAAAVDVLLCALTVRAAQRALAQAPASQEASATQQQQPREIPNAASG